MMGGGRNGSWSQGQYFVSGQRPRAKYCNKVSVNSFASTKSSIFQRLSILRVFLFWFAAEPGRREPAGRPQVPAQRRRHQAACLPVSAASGSSASQSAFSMLQ